MSKQKRRLFLVSLCKKYYIEIWNKSFKMVKIGIILIVVKIKFINKVKMILIISNRCYILYIAKYRK